MLDDRRVHKITPQVIRVPRAAALTSSTAMDGQSAEELLQPLEDLAKFDETRDSQLPLVISFLLADAGTSVLFLRFFCGVFSLKVWCLLFVFLTRQSCLKPCLLKCP